MHKVEMPALVWKASGDFVGGAWEGCSLEERTDPQKDIMSESTSFKAAISYRVIVFGHLEMSNIGRSLDAAWGLDG